ncbi:MAG: S9 family peptidase [candidate division WOR-3 bacterium]|nr:MAG: S9 family peptidase [candidate division WOR-3 bacterium]
MKKRLVSIQDLYRMKFLREITLSPCGTKVAFTVEWLDKKKNKYYSNLYVVSTKGTLRHYIRGKKDIKRPQWSPDGAWISFILTDPDKKKRKQNLWLIPSDGGEAFALTDVDGMFGTYVWAPDSKDIVCEYMHIQKDKDREPERDKPPLYYHHREMWYKLDGKGMLPDEKPHIWRVNVRSGAMKQLTFGEHGDGSPALSADGKWIVFVSNRQSNWLKKFLHQDLYVIRMDGKKEHRIKTPAGPKSSPVFSPEGSSICYVGRERPDEWFGWLNDYLYLVGRDGGKPVNLTRRLDRSVPGYIIDDLGHYAENRPVFSEDGRFVYYIVSDRGDSKLFAVDIAKHKTVTLWGEDRVVYAFDHDGKGTFAIAAADPGDTGNLYLIKEKKCARLTKFNQQYLTSRRLARPEEFTFRGDGGDMVQGWILKPPNFRKGRKYPLIVQIHGGPYAAYGNSLFHEFQVLAAAGYVVFYSNPHGSIGYGERYARALHNRWGIPDTKDILKAVSLLRKKTYIDKKRVGIMGGSYGGYMTNWIIGHTNTFKAAITMRSVVNMISFFSNDFGWGFPWEFKGNWWDRNNYSFYWNMSPLKYVQNIKTPLLIIHSEQDHRCPIGQAEELFVALKLLGREVEMVRFPAEPHGLSRHGSPRRREKRLEFIVNFMDRHLKK